jgi:putative membrane protein
MFRRTIYLPALAIIFLVFAVAMAINPLDRHDWMLENVLVILFVVLVAATYRQLPLSRISYTLIFLFLTLHEIGSHYTYALVPYDDWFRSMTGTGLNELLGFERNHFDRFTHFAYGLLLAYPIREIFIRIAEVKGFWSYFLPLDLTMSTSMLYELVEWGAAEFFGGELGQAYLGTQGDVWDAHKDMALASLGALIAMSLTAGLNAWLQHDFAKEWNESLRIKQKLPLGEDEIARMRRRSADR